MDIYQEKSLEKRLAQIINVARGAREADVLLKDVNLVNVLSGEVYQTNVILKGNTIAGVGERYEKAIKILDFQGKYLLPGLIDGHVHIESSMVSVPEYAKAVVPHGTTSVVADPHEIANVLGLKGIRYMLDSSKGVPLNLFLMAPSCVPATDLETSGATLNDREIKELLGWEQVLGLAELMNYPGVIYGIPEVIRKVKTAKEADKVIDGHSPRLSGEELNAYISVGVSSEHECTSKEEALEKLRLGMWIMIREGSAAKNLSALLPLVTDANFGRCLFVTDDKHPGDLIREGHIDHILRRAVSSGLDPVRAVQMATINVANRFGLRGLGAIAPGYTADLAVVEDLESFKTDTVFKDGQVVASGGELTVEIPKYEDLSVLETIHVSPLVVDDFKIKTESERVKLIKLVPDQIITRKRVEKVKIENGFIVSDPENDILKLAVVERHKATGNIGLGLVKGFGLRRGALASSVAHDSHNIIVVGTNDEDMLTAVNKVVEMGGGYVAACQGRVLASLPLPIAGLMSDRSVQEVQEGLEELHRASSELGGRVKSPFITLSFLALPVIPELKLSDKGLVDVTKFGLVPIEGD